MVVVAYKRATPHSVILFVAAAVVVLAAFSCILKFCIIIKSPPTILKIASVKTPATNALLAVIIGGAPPVAPCMVIVELRLIPVAVIT